MKQKTQPIRRSLIAAVALLMVLVTTAALAVGLKRSKQVEVKSIARQVLMKEYGLDQQSIAMFSENAEEKNGVWKVTYGAWNPERAGEYTVVVKPDGGTETSWSLENQNGWTQKEIAEYIRQKNEKVLADIAKETVEGIPTAEPMPVPTESAGTRLNRQQVIEIADEAMKQQYHFQEKGLAEFDAGINDFEDGIWQVEYMANGWHWKDGYLSEKAGSYLVKISDETGEVTEIRWNIMAEDPNTYTRETFGKAKAYDAQCMEWVAEIRAEFVKAYTAAETSRWPVPVEEMARLDSLMIAAGFDPDQYNHVVPGEKDLSLEAALEIAAQALQNEYGVSRETVDKASYAYTDLTQEEEHRQWYFWIQDHAIQMGWQITLDAQTGEILDMSQEAFAAGNG